MEEPNFMDIHRRLVQSFEEYARKVGEEEEDGPEESEPSEAAPAILKKSGLLYLAAFFVIVFIVVGVAGNLLTIVAIARHPRVRSATAAFIVSLCVADFLFCAINLPFSASRFINQKWIHGDTLCVVFPFLRYANVGLSLLSITAITINRYILIVHPRVYERIYQRKFIFCMVAFVWCFSFSLVLPTLLGRWGRFGYDPKILNCSILPDETGRSSKTFLFIFGFLLPCLAIVVCYARIFWTVRESQRRIHKHVIGTVDGVGLDSRFRTNDLLEQKRKREEWRVTRMVLVIFCSFVICYLPITIVKVADKSVSYPSLHIVGYILIFMSACINPIIYGVTNKQYRQAYKATLLCRAYRVSSTGMTRGSSGGQGQTQDSSGAASRTCVSMVVGPACNAVYGDTVLAEDKI